MKKIFVLVAILVALAAAGGTYWGSSAPDAYWGSKAASPVAASWVGPDPDGWSWTGPDTYWGS